MNREHYVKVAVGAAIAAGGALITYAGQWAVSGDFGVYGPVVAAAASVALNALRVYAKSIDAGVSDER
jgi:hypothetical protein